MDKMTKTQFMKKVRALTKTTSEEIIKKAQKFTESGAVEFADYENNFALPKIFMTVACSDMAWQWQPLTDEHKKTVKNIKHFV
jgi:hypothetical protein